MTAHTEQEEPDFLKQKIGGASVKLKCGSTFVFQTKDSLKGEEDHA